MAPISHTRAIRELQQEVEEMRRVLMAQAAPAAPMTQTEQEAQAIPPVATQTTPILPPAPGPTTALTVPIIEQFRRYRPPSFDGGDDPLAAEEWLRTIEKIFRHISCPENQKVLCAEFMLVEEPAIGGNPHHGDKDITEYERKFEELSHYTPHLVSTEHMKAKRFEKGLRPEIRQIVKKGNARIFSMTHDEAAQDPNVITGILSIYSIPVYVLIDFGAMRSFIFATCLANINISCEKTSSTLEVSMPSGGVIDTNKIAKAIQIDFDGLILEADLHVIELKDFDIILGMDWLGSNRAIIVCFEKEVIFKRPGEEEFRFYRSKIKALPRIILAMQAKKLLMKKTCQGYLVSLTGTPSEELTLDRVPLVQEYTDVFPDELPSAPIDRQVEFIIDLIPGAALVSKAPYCMAPKELQELKMQLEELLNKGFIKPSVSLWGAPILFCEKERWNHENVY
ncbi:uncharacterized protein LOC111373183 [Olea europaea var. sylvestris]|uniref:uncharacterized protein LOC111373183 n=1 Tax=Olea europaea var. sylvestris TaxID=158386 RepID=UPI000C1D74C1|nr:uncharacterized protein LOC111373183 [Olea europaea var. sylvestris]